MRNWSTSHKERCTYGLLAQRGSSPQLPSFYQGLVDTVGLERNGTSRPVDIHFGLGSDWSSVVWLGLKLSRQININDASYTCKCTHTDMNTWLYPPTAFSLMLLSIKFSANPLTCSHVRTLQHFEADEPHRCERFILEDASIYYNARFDGEVVLLTELTDTTFTKIYRVYQRMLLTVAFVPKIVPRLWLNHAGGSWAVQPSIHPHIRFA